MAEKRRAFADKESCSIPALKVKKGEWVTNAKGKAELLAKTFSAKYVLPDEVTTCYSDLQKRPPQANWQAPPESAALEVLTKLRDESATGPDLVPTRLLHHCAKALAELLHRLACRILETGHRPTLWLEHWIIPLYKKKAVWNPDNYRGVHLTSQLAKCTERLLQKSFEKFLNSATVSGPNQFAYKKQKGARDVLAVLTLTWITGFNRKKKFGLYNADVSGAFDRVCTKRLIEKLRAQGVPEQWVSLLESWLRERRALVAVGGQYSEAVKFHDMVFQGTVWGPILWNVYFADVRLAVRSKGFEEIMYADDMNAYKDFSKTTDNEEVLSETRECKAETHEWGGPNTVSFDPKKKVST